MVLTAASEKFITIFVSSGTLRCRTSSTRKKKFFRVKPQKAARPIRGQLKESRSGETGRSVNNEKVKR